MEIITTHIIKKRVISKYRKILLKVIRKWQTNNKYIIRTWNLTKEVSGIANNQLKIFISDQNKAN